MIYDLKNKTNNLVNMKKFRKIYIEITNKCNLKCSFCVQHNRKPHHMSCDEFELVIKKLYQRGDNFFLHLMGEPTSHPQFKQILQVCTNYGIKTNLTTNGTLLAYCCNDILKSNLKSINISIHSFEQNQNGCLQEYLDKVVNFCKLASTTNTTVELRLWTMRKESFTDVDNINFKIIKYLSDNFNLSFDIFEKMNQTFFSMQKNRKKNFKLINNVYLGMSEQFQWPSLKNSPNTTCVGFCYGLRNQIAILCDGTVVPCCLDSCGDIALGNIFKEDIDTILSKPRSIAMYTGFTNHKAVEPLCQSCGYMKKYMQIKHTNNKNNRKA